ncbi:MAG TPA: gliding motility-associated ABC transporter substrate-binding protein GldG [Flavobacteriales bacterium]|nr:gliding motility-associated ABC transporter substrate-binding protein GldG [Flavobacteriales bacterium]HIO68392.1 gliding motility-associated ABC transporter substrate-binding protein GldG [Flavobacteriales bacterium]
MVGRKQVKRQNLIQLVGGLLIIVLINVIGSFKFERFDLTTEKRYTLSPATKTLISNLEDVMYVRVYLEGDFPAAFKRLQRSTKEMLDEMRAYSNGNLDYEFINPSESADEKTKRETYQELVKQGLQPTLLEVTESDGSAQKTIFPGAIFAYHERELPLQLLQSQMGSSPEIQLNNSIQTLEYEIGNTIKKLTSKFQPKLAFIEGHGELNRLEVDDITRTLSQYYRVERKAINGKLGSLDDFKAIIIARPRIAFNEKDKFVIDQYIMNGGKAIWCLDAVQASMDSLTNSGMTMGVPYNLNLSDQLFRYGCRINANLIQDVQSALLPINIAPPGADAQWKRFPWIFFPLLTPTNAHPIGKNLEWVRAEFVSTIDTVAAEGVDKTFLLFSSQYSRVLNAPVQISLQAITALPDESQFNRSFLATAVLLSGKFPSVFSNRIPREIAKDSSIAFKDLSDETEMIIISDGDIIRNQVQYQTGRSYPLGFDKYTGQQFGNSNFVMNCIDYLCDESNLISVRSRELKIRLLDKTKIQKDKAKWQAANMVIPILIILCIGLVRGIIRKRKYT